MSKFVEKPGSLGGGAFFDWKDKPVGTIVRGRYVAICQGNILSNRQTYYAKLQQADGTELKVSLPTSLERRLRDDYDLNDTLEITYNGRVKGKQAQPYHDFTVKFEVPDDYVAPAQPAAAAPPVAVAPAAKPPIDLAAIAAAAAAPTQSKWESLKATLEAKNPKAAPALLNALKDMTPAEAEGALENYLKQSGLLQ